MPECDQCESWVTSEYVRVFAINGTVKCCPWCENHTRDRNGRKRKARSSRQAHRGADGSRRQEADD